MENIWDEGIKTVDGFPLPVDCLVMPHTEPQLNWENMHYHEYIEILYPLKGDYEVMLNGDIFYMPEHSMFVIAAGEPHCTRALNKKDHLLTEKEEHVLMCIKFIPQVLYSSTQSVNEVKYSLPFIFDRFGSKRMFEPDLLKNTPVPETFAYILKEHEQNAFGYELVIRSGVLRIFAWILRYWHDSMEEHDVLVFSDNAAEMLQKVRQYVDENYAEATLTEAANICGLSYSYFSRVFNKYMKMNFSDYVNLVRVNNSLKLLSSRDQSITDIALSVGFSSTSYYIQVFKKLKHISPYKFRKQFIYI